MYLPNCLAWHYWVTYTEYTLFNDAVACINYSAWKCITKCFANIYSAYTSGEKVHYRGKANVLMVFGWNKYSFCSCSSEKIYIQSYVVRTTQNSYLKLLAISWIRLLLDQVMEATLIWWNLGGGLEWLQVRHSTPVYQIGTIVAPYQIDII